MPRAADAALADTVALFIGPKPLGAAAGAPIVMLFVNARPFPVGLDAYPKRMMLANLDFS